MFGMNKYRKINDNTLFMHQTLKVLHFVSSKNFQIFLVLMCVFIYTI